MPCALDLAPLRNKLPKNNRKPQRNGNDLRLKNGPVKSGKILPKQSKPESPPPVEAVALVGVLCFLLPLAAAALLVGFTNE
jgi:hypothetical protein